VKRARSKKWRMTKVVKTPWRRFAAILTHNAGDVAGVWDRITRASASQPSSCASTDLARERFERYGAPSAARRPVYLPVMH